MSEKGLESTIEQLTDDPWIDSYLAYRTAWLKDEFTTLADVEEYALEVKRGLPPGTPSIPAAIFIMADIAITFPQESSPELMAALWIPR